MNELFSIFYAKSKPDRRSRCRARKYHLVRTCFRYYSRVCGSTSLVLEEAVFLDHIEESEDTSYLREAFAELLRETISIPSSGTAGTALLGAMSVAETLDWNDEERAFLREPIEEVLFSENASNRDRSSALQALQISFPVDALSLVRGRITNEQDQELLLSMVGVFNQLGDNSDLETLSKIQLGNNNFCNTRSDTCH